jgi:hypothetical protein
MQDFNVATLPECFAQDTSQAACKHESWSCIAQFVDEGEPEKVTALTDAIISAVSAEHADKLGGFAALFKSSHSTAIQRQGQKTEEEEES